MAYKKGQQSNQIKAQQRGPLMQPVVQAADVILIAAKRVRCRQDDQDGVAPHNAHMVTSRVLWQLRLLDMPPIHVGIYLLHRKSSIQAVQPQATLLAQLALSIKDARVDFQQRLIRRHEQHLLHAGDTNVGQQLFTTINALSARAEHLANKAGAGKVVGVSVLRVAGEHQIGIVDDGLPASSSQLLVVGQRLAAPPTRAAATGASHGKDLAIDVLMADSSLALAREVVVDADARISRGLWRHGTLSFRLTQRAAFARLPRQAPQA